MTVNLTTNSSIKTNTRNEIYLGIFQNLTGTITVESNIYLSTNLKVKKILKLKLNIQDIFNDIINLHECIGISILSNAPPI